MPAPGYTKRRYRWTQDEVIAKVREWHERYGDIPSAVDWNASDTRRATSHHAKLARRWLGRLRRFEEGEWPWTGTVYKLFGGWNNAMREAGFEPRPAYGPREPIDLTGTLADLSRLSDAVRREKDADLRRTLLLEIAERALALAEPPLEALDPVDR